MKEKDNRRKMETGITLDKDVIRKLDAQAQGLGLSRSAMINMVLRQSLGLVPDMKE